MAPALGVVMSLFEREGGGGRAGQFMIYSCLECFKLQRWPRLKRDSGESRENGAAAFMFNRLFRFALHDLVRVVYVLP